MKKYLKGMNLVEIEEFINENNIPKYRANQIFRWLYHNQVLKAIDMNNLPNDLKELIEKNYVIKTLDIHKIDESLDTKKFLFKTKSGDFIESVSMLENDRHTICISSQVGCSVDCDFCATGKMGFKKNLNAGEIVDQIILVQSQIDNPITNIVFMGMGEPFLNYQNVLKAADLITHQNGLNFSYKRITISTSGILPKIKTFINDKIKYNLAVSLNATLDSVRDTLMPINKKWPIQSLIDIAPEYNKIHKSGLTFEYVLIDSVNDSSDDAARLAKLFRNSGCKINIIPFNEIGNMYQRPSNYKIEKFVNVLNNLKKGFTLLVRWSKGTSINAGCGQLAIKNDT